MSIHKLYHLDMHTAYLIWYIEEKEEEFIRILNPNEPFLSIQHTVKRLEFLASRIAYQQLCKEMALPYNPLLKDNIGKPYIANSTACISISHCYPFAVVAISMHSPIGIDIQIPNDKLRIVQEKYLNASELQAVNQDMDKLCLYWCAKEAIYKAEHRETLSFSKIEIMPFIKQEKGTLLGNYLGRYRYSVCYNLESAYTICWCQM